MSTEPTIVDPGTPVSGRQPRILVCDDTDGNRYAVSRLLRGAGMLVDEAKNGAEALKLAGEHPDLIVLDINLPDISGYEVLRRLKSNQDTALIPMMHVTASYVQPSDHAFGLDSGADAYLTHPVDPRIFISTVRALLRVADTEARLRAAAIERGRLLEEADNARREAESANRAKSAFLATMSHELRTPLNAIAGYVELLEIGVRGPLSAEQLEYLYRIRKSERLLLSVINDILNFARLEAGHVEFNVVPTPIGEIMDGVSEIIEAQMREKDIKFTRVDFDPGIIAMADRERAEQIVLNLLSNAVKFTDAGGTIAVSSATTPETVRIIVTDSGRGVPADKLEVIFDPFVQVDRHLTDGTLKGTGLGLSISRDLARRMNGTLKATSKLGTGTAFVLELKRAK